MKQEMLSEEDENLKTPQVEIGTQPTSKEKATESTEAKGKDGHHQTEMPTTEASTDHRTSDPDTGTLPKKPKPIVGTTADGQNLQGENTCVTDKLQLQAIHGDPLCSSQNGNGNKRGQKRGHDDDGDDDDTQSSHKTQKLSTKSGTTTSAKLTGSEATNSEVTMDSGATTNSEGTTDSDGSTNSGIATSSSGATTVSSIVTSSSTMTTSSSPGTTTTNTQVLYTAKGIVPSQRHLS